MCGIFGVVLSSRENYDTGFFEGFVKDLALYSESRGKDSAGLVFRYEKDKRFDVLKGAITLNKLFKKDVVSTGFREIDQNLNHQRVVIGHSRLVTNGTQLSEDNNQPVVKDGIIGVHNGIIVNVDDLWRSHDELTREFEIDTEILLALCKEYLDSSKSLKQAVHLTMKEIKGTVSAALLFNQIEKMVVFTNNGSLYTLRTQDGLFSFASEEYFLREVSKKYNVRKNAEIEQIKPGYAVIIDLVTGKVEEYRYDTFSGSDEEQVQFGYEYAIQTHALSENLPQRELVLDPAQLAVHHRASSEAALLEDNLGVIRHLRRCTKCILPETFPFIGFDEKGVCNYCKNYKIKNQPKPISELFELVKPYRRSKGQVDCIVPYSGGRDSTHTLHIVKNVLGLNPIAFTYDWGMVNDLARRNIARVCGKLGVENIIVSADIAWKRENIRRNIVAWLNNPHVGMVPLFMAGDKYFYYFTEQVKKQTGVKLNIWGVNPLENTDFKVGFMGVAPDFNKKRIYSLSLQRQLKLFFGVGRVIANNLGYLNRSMFDTMGSFFSRSIAPHRDYYHMYDYYRWDEEEINTLVLNEYEWEKAVDTDTTWRIGDGTAPFYNYIYYTVAGFSEYDTFRSNQIREGMITRDKALELVHIENKPRYPSIKWYTEVLGLDYNEVIKAINSIPKLYRD